jgi:hypothetical protein
MIFRRPTACRWFASDPGNGTGSCHRPGRPAAITRHIVLVMAALATCTVTAALLKDRTDT